MARLFLFAGLLTALMGCGAISSSAASQLTIGKATSDDPARMALIARSQVWAPTNVRAMDLKTGPGEAGAFPFQATITCDYFKKEFEGNSPKFACRAGEDELKVKYSVPLTGYLAGRSNAEVFAEVAATRLAWALGFGADRMYPVRVICRGCPSNLGGTERPNNERVFDPATIERKMPGVDLEPDSAWSWEELDLVDESRGGAPRAHRDALKLLAVFIQHTDTKPQQQRLVCVGKVAGEAATAANCSQPFMMLNDLGVTFGRANAMNRNSNGMNYVLWAATPIWKDGATCIGNLPKSFTGTLNNPVISEEGRAFLANLLMQLSDNQIRALFEAARVNLRLRDPGKASSGLSTVEEWTDVFKRKRAEIVDRRCA